MNPERLKKLRRLYSAEPCLVGPAEAKRVILNLLDGIESLHREYESDRAALTGVLLEAEKYVHGIQDQQEYDDEQYGRNVVNMLAGTVKEEVESRKDNLRRELLQKTQQLGNFLVSSNSLLLKHMALKYLAVPQKNAARMRPQKRLNWREIRHAI